MSIEINIKKKLGSFTLSVHLNSANKVVGLLGSSGCGKSMTLRCIAGVETPDEGYIRINGITVYDSEKRINLPPQKRHVGILFQNYALFPNMTLEQNIRCGFRKKAAANAERLEELLAQFQLTELRNHYPTQLSGGQQQRAALARCLASDPGIILLDEPFSALDSALKQKLQLQLKKQLETYDGTVILVTHDRDEAYLLSDTIAIMSEGTILKADTRETIFNDPGCSAAARLIGCKNVVKAEKTGEHTLFIPGYQTSLTLQKTIPDDLTAVGIRAHDFIPTAEMGENCVKIRLAQITEYPFDWNGIFHTEGPEDIFWVQSKQTLNMGHTIDLTDYFQIRVEEILLLSD